MSKNKKLRHTQEDQQGEGRQYDSHNKVAEERDRSKDIGRVDQQEGAMDHGEFGGNFTNDEDQSHTRGNK